MFFDDGAGRAASGDRAICRRRRARHTTPGRCASRVALAALLALSLAGPGVVSAAEYTPARKVGRGFTNLTLGVLAIPGEMVEQSEDHGAAIGVPLGFATGLGWFVARECVGLWEFLTSPFEFPRGYRPIIEPEYPWQQLQ